MNWFTYSNINIDNQPKTYKTREVDCLDCEEILETRDYEETFTECYYCGSKKLGNEQIKINPNI
jgi:DNA-directed RNA polymerase subunit RPC12/RpoP